MVARLALDQLIMVRIHGGQLKLSKLCEGGGMADATV